MREQGVQLLLRPLLRGGVPVADCLDPVALPGVLRDDDGETATGAPARDAVVLDLDDGPAVARG